MGGIEGGIGVQIIDWPSHAQLRDRAAEAEAIRVYIEPTDPTGWGPRNALPQANDAIVDEGIVRDDPDS